MAWVPVYLGTGGIGLVPLSNLYADRVDTIDDSDAVRLPGSGSLGRRAVAWDTHTVFGVDPYDWQFLIAPDILAGDVKVSHDGGETWSKDLRLTAQILKGGASEDVRRRRLSHAGHQDRVRPVPRRADPHRHPRRGRDLHDPRREDVAHHHELGPHQLRHGLSFLSQRRGPHRELGPWNLVSPQNVGMLQDRSALLASAHRRSETSQRAAAFWRKRQKSLQRREARRTRGSPSSSFSSASRQTGVAGLGPDNRLEVWGRGFPAGQEVILRIREVEPRDTKLREKEFPERSVAAGKDGVFSTSVQIPEDLPHGMFIIEAVDDPLASSSPPPISSNRIRTNRSRESDRRVWCPDYGLAASATACKNHGIKGQGYGGPARRTAGSRPTNDRFSGSELRAGSEVRREGAGSLGHRSPQRETPDHVAVALRSKPSAKTAARSPR